jgi:hypothetical protein
MIVWLLKLLSLRHGTHYYLSTACLHGGDGHGYCNAPTVTRDGEWEAVGPSYSSNQDEPKRPAECKFCSAPCRCRCHKVKYSQSVQEAT